MRILVGCEESGKVRDAFNRIHGCMAWSNDILPARNEGPHLQMDVFEAIEHYGPWSIIILHPDCTKIAVSGNRWYGRGMPRHNERVEAKEWVIRLWNHAKKYCDKVALENPVGVIGRSLGCSPQYIGPDDFGHPESKKTGLWLYNLPRLIPTNKVAVKYQRIWRMGPHPNRKRDRSETYQGIADAMAQQWSNL